MDIVCNDLDLAAALTCLEAGAVLFAQKVANETGRPVPDGGAVLHDPVLALRALKQQARTASNPRLRDGALQVLATFFGVSVDETRALIAIPDAAGPWTAPRLVRVA